MMTVTEPRLPRNDPPPNLALLVIGNARAKAYQSSMEEPLSRTLAAIVREIEAMEKGTAKPSIRIRGAGCGR